MKKPLTAGRVIKRIILSLLAVILIAAVIVFLYVKFKVFPQIQKFMNDPEVISMLDDLQQADIDSVLNTIDGVIDGTQLPAGEGSSVNSGQGTTDPAAVGNSPAGAENMPTEEEIARAVIMPTPPPELKKPTSTQNAQKDSGQTGGNKTSDLTKDIPAGDMAAAASLASKVDPGYILGLLSGGLTPEEKKELKDYLTGRLSGAEISKGIELYNKYSYLLR